MKNPLLTSQPPLYCIKKNGRQNGAAARFFAPLFYNCAMQDFIKPAPPGAADFGFADVAVQDKTPMVDGVFSQVAPYYGRMNDIMSAGMHRIWKDAAVFFGGVRPGMRVLDLACGGGDLAARVLPKIAPGGQLTLADINAPMLELARKRLPGARFVRCNGEQLPFAEGSFDRVFIGFGLRNIARREIALSEMRRVLRPGGLAAVLEFAPPRGFFVGAKKWYLRAGLPFLGRVFFNDANNYRYLGESILRFPPPQQLAEMLRAAGFVRADFLPVAAGAVYLHRGRKVL
ncbi:MAG: ubiquinone/menaquinone biosynthesis methyltransferase [Betaproteobacteria bacterium]|nr:ubiquinone/menaquinone biosynthesis methyltransferase [Betaproteobacteria bacterium]